MKHTPHSPSEIDKLLNLAEGREMISMQEIAKAGLSRTCVSRLEQQGKLERLGRGLYRRPDGPLTEYHDLLIVCAQVDPAVIVLISALSFHQLGTQVPHAVWFQIQANQRVPKIQWPPTEVIKTRLPELMKEGVAYHDIGGHSVAVTNPARTVADCFKYRNRIGLDVALEALKELLRRDRNCVDEVMKYARMNRVSNIILPYMEASV